VSETLGVEWRPIEEAWLSAGLFRHDLSDIILADVVSEGGAGTLTRFTFVNVASGTSQGLELSARLSPFAWIRFDAGYTFTDAHDDATGEPLQGRTRHRATFSALWQPKSLGLEVNLRGSIVGSRPYTLSDDMGNPVPVDADSYAPFDLHASWRFAGHVRIFAGVDNVFDAGDHKFASVTPRAFYAGATGTY
jgi:outer membrane receptor for ferrienterochelin and colicins